MHQVESTIGKPNKGAQSMARVFNFSAGPATLPEPVLQQAKEEMLDWHDMGASIMEISHRSPEFRDLAEESKQDLRDLLNIPENYTILFLQGGARSQFAMVPMNLLGTNKKAAYSKTGVWSKIAATEAERFGDVQFVCDMESTKFTTITPENDWQAFSDAAYLHYVDNETVNGIEFPFIPDSHGLPLICDMSSNILSRPFDVSRYGIFYACAQKNLGPAGVTVVVIRNDLLEREPLVTTPSMFRYALHAENNSLMNTAPTYPWYIASLVLKWLKQQGGLEAIDQINQRKAEKLYHVIDQSDFYYNPIDPQYRSRMNVIFTLPNHSELEADFVKQAVTKGLYGLKGHRFLGGMRASIYNAMPEAGVDALVDFMRDFEKQNG